MQGRIQFVFARTVREVLDVAFSVGALPRRAGRSSRAGFTEQVNLMVTHTPHICVQPPYNLIPSVFANHRDPPATTLSSSRPPQLYTRNIVYNITVISLLFCYFALFLPSVIRVRSHAFFFLHSYNCTRRPLRDNRTIILSPRSSEIQHTLTPGFRDASN